MPEVEETCGQGGPSVGLCLGLSKLSLHPHQAEGRVQAAMARWLVCVDPSFHSFSLVLGAQPGWRPGDGEQKRSDQPAEMGVCCGFCLGSSFLEVFPSLSLTYKITFQLKTNNPPPH